MKCKCWKCGLDFNVKPSPRHALLCGDATDTAQASRAMCGEKAHLAFIDPPHNVDYEGYTDDRLKIQGDKKTPEQFRIFLLAAFRSCATAVRTDGSMYVCHSSSWQREFQDALEAAGFEIRCQIIWAKNTFAWGFGRYKFQHEPMFYVHVAGQSDAWYGDKSESTLWQIPKPAASRLHRTMKPIALVIRAIENSSRNGDIVGDLFAGSGSTLIACEKTGRRARLMELDPIYCDVIVRRWQNFTGREATLEGDGPTFAHVEFGRMQEREDHDKDDALRLLEERA
jgi:DNA modification methylase